MSIRALKDPLILGCMRIEQCTPKELDILIHGAMELGIKTFDHADIYGQGRCESAFGKVLSNSPGLREQMFLQSKCGIHSGTYDFSYEHIMNSTDGILARLHTDHLDRLLFHRPDLLAEQEDFSRAIADLKAQGKVLSFGVSNMNSAQIQLLESWSGQSMEAVQMQLSLMHPGLAAAGFHVNSDSSEFSSQDGSLIPYCQMTGKVLQAWSPLQYGMFSGCFLNNPQFPDLNQRLREIGEVHHVPASAVALAWILRIPGNVQAVLGATNLLHLKEGAQAAGTKLTRQEWYSLYKSCGYSLP